MSHIFLKESAKFDLLISGICGQHASRQRSFSAVSSCVSLVYIPTFALFTFFLLLNTVNRLQQLKYPFR